MIKRFWVCGIVACGLCFGATGAVAQEGDDPVPTKNYDMEIEVIEGKIKTVDVTFYRGMEPAKFERLLRLKKSFLPQIADSAQSGSLGR